MHVVPRGGVSRVMHDMHHIYHMHLMHNMNHMPHMRWHMHASHEAHALHASFVSQQAGPIRLGPIRLGPMDLLQSALRALQPPSPPAIPAVPPQPRPNLRGYVPLNRVASAVARGRKASQQGDLAHRAQMLHHDAHIAKRRDDCMVQRAGDDSKRGRGAYWKEWTTAHCLRSAYGDVDKAVRSSAKTSHSSHASIRENRAAISKLYLDG